MRLEAGGECRARRNWSNGGAFQAGCEPGDPEPGPSPSRRRSRWEERRSATWAQAAGETGFRRLISQLS